MGDLEPLSKILKGNSDPSSTRQLSDAARQVLTQAEYAIQRQQVHYIGAGRLFVSQLLRLPK